MKQATSIILTALLLCVSFSAPHAATPAALTLEDIFSRTDGIQYLSYQTQITSPANTVARFRIWIHNENVYGHGFFGPTKQIGKKSYVYHNDQWVESPGLTINTVLVFLKEARKAGDTRIVGPETLDGKPTTVIEYTQPRPSWGSEIKMRLWISHEHYIPVRIKTNNLTQKKVQTEEITHISFDEEDHKAFFKEMEAFKERRRRILQKQKAWNPEKEAAFEKMLQMDQQDDLTARQKIGAWEDFLGTMPEDDSSTQRDDYLRGKSRSQINYWKSIRRSENETAFEKMLQMDQQDDLTAKQKIDAWGNFLETISVDDPAISRDDHMRSKSSARIDYWKYVSRLVYYPNGILKDTQTDLEWFNGPDKDMSWEEAQSWAGSLDVDGGGWRLPTVDELKTLYQKGAGEHNLTPYLKTVGRSGYVWSGERRNKPTSWCFGYTWAKKTAYGIKHSKEFRAFAVRGPN